MRSPDWKVVYTALLVGAGYYFGAKVGLALTFQPNPISLLWPPNSILLAALVLTPPRAWWAVLVAALAAHLTAELQGGVPVAMVLCWYVSNTVEALIGAAFIRRLTRGPGTLQTLHDVIVLLVAAILAPFLSSFLDSAFVKLIGWGSGDYWELWKTRFLSNVVAGLTVIPLIVTWARGGIAAARSARRLRLVEACVVLGGLLGIAVAVFDTALTTNAPLVVLYLPLPFLLWAALRFGMIGASTSFALVAFLVIWGAGKGLGPVGGALHAETALSVQLFLIFVGPLLFCLAALSEEGRSANRLLRDSEERFAKAFLSSPTAMSITRRANGEIIEVNDEWEILCGYDREEAAGNTAVDLGLYDASVNERVKHLVGAMGRVTHLEIDLRAKHGEVRHVVMAVETVDMGGEPSFITNLTDVTERRRTDELNQRLAHASRLTAMGELTASIAHEVNQPMSAILANLDAAEMLLDAGKGSDAELRQILADIRSDDLRASEVIRHVRGLANKRQVDLQPFDLNDLVAAVLRLVAPLAQRRGVAVSAEYGKLPPLHGDRIYVQQVLLNLLFNGMDAMAETPEGQRQLMVRTEYDRRIGVTVSVRDSGHGIAPSDLERIFDSFFTTKKDGMGLGLSIARTLIEAHGGRIRAENNANGGATIRFTLPLRLAQPNARTAARVMR